MLTIQKKISTYNNSGRNGNSILYIVVHYTGNRGDTAKNNVDFFYNGDRGASAHYFVDNNSIWQSVEDYRAAWAVGDGSGMYGITNSNSISVEMCCQLNGEVSESTEKNTVDLVKHLMKVYNVPIENVVRHYDASRKVCPNWSANNWQRWFNFKNRIMSNTTVCATVESAKAFVGKRCRELQEKLNKVGYNCGVVDGIFGVNTYNALIKFQSENGLTVDALAGDATFAKLDEIISKNKPTVGKIADLQRLCNKIKGLNLAVDGLWGPKTDSAVKTLPCCGLPYTQRELTVWVQLRVGVNPDGIFGNGTKNAVINYQRKNGLSADGIVGYNTYKSMALK